MARNEDRAQYPIIYVRGYAGSQGAVEDTVATPYMGFNQGATKLRQLHTKKIIANVFESPLIRLMIPPRFCAYPRDCGSGRLQG